MDTILKKPFSVCVGIVLSLLLSACAHKTAPVDCDPADFELLQACLASLKQQALERPSDAAARVAYLTAKERAISAWLTDASKQPGDAGAPARSTLYRQVLGIEPQNARAIEGLTFIERDTRRSKALMDAQFALDLKDYAAAQPLIRQVLNEDPGNARAKAMQALIQASERQSDMDPALSTALQQTMSIEFKDATLKQVFEVLSRTSGINFVLDREVKSDQKASVTMKDASTKSILDVVLQSNQLEPKVIDKKTILIYPNTTAKQKDHQALSVRTFFLSNADAEQVSNSLKTILKTRDLVVDKSQNLLIMRDSVDAVRLAEKIVSMQDSPVPEVMLELEVLEINRSRLSTLGVKIPAKISLSPLSRSNGTTVTLSDLVHANASSIGASLSSLQISATATDGDIKLLANPRIRVKNREAAKILIGDRVPNITSTSTATGFVSENIQYLDVGLKVEATPVISIDNEVSIKIALEVSSIANQLTTPSGTTAYQIGTRSASTILRLRDGENQILAGLINNEDRRTTTKVPGLGDIPVLGLLFAEKADTKNNTEIVLSVTPRIVRNTPRPDASLIDFESGTETNLRAGTLRLPPPPSNSTQQKAQPPLPAPLAPDASRAKQSRLAPSTGSTQSNNEALPAALASQAPGDPKVTGAQAIEGATAEGANASADNKPPAVAEGPKGGVYEWSGPQTVTPGALVKQTLMVSGAHGLSAISAVFTYDPSMLTFDSVKEEAEGNPGGASVQTRVDASNGHLHVSLSRRTGTAADAGVEGALLTVTFQARDTLTHTLLQTGSFSLLGSDGTSVPAKAPAAIGIDAVAQAAPEPLK